MFLLPNQKKFLSSFNPLFVVFFLSLCILLRTTVDPLFGSLARFCDLMIPASVYFGQRRALIEGIILTLFTSHLFSLCSGAPIGVFAAQYLILFFLARVESRILNAQTWWSILAVMFIFAILSRFSLAIISQLFGHGWRLFTFNNFHVGRIVMTPLIGFFVYYILEKIDQFTFKTAPINIELSA